MSDLLLANPAPELIRLSLTPLQQLERLEADSQRLTQRERVMREAERQLSQTDDTHG